MCIKTLPPVLCIQLKRFGFDWEANRALKFDDYFKFPWVIDMEPYTSEGMTWRESVDTGSQEEIVVTSGVRNSKQINYELVGVVVHSGQANAGHYYSYIRDRRGNVLTNPHRGKWFKYNDTQVEEFELTDETMEEECFGGTYKANASSQWSSRVEDRLRYWNGYLLFYEQVEGPPQTPVSAKKSRVTRLKRPDDDNVSTSKRSSDSLVELTELVHKGEKRGLFMDRMPSRIQQSVRDENLRFMKNRDIYNEDYFAFIYNLSTVNMQQSYQPQYTNMCVTTLKFTVHFLFNTYLRTRKQLRFDLENWEEMIAHLLTKSKPASMWMIEFLSSDQGKTYIKPFLLECSSCEIRQTFANILERTMSSFFHHGGVTTYKPFDELIEVILQMLTTDVPENCKTCTQYFAVLSSYVQNGTKSCAHMFGRNAFPRLMTFLLGSNNATNNSPEPLPRRWSSLQARDFGPLHATLATLILNSNVTGYHTEDRGDLAILLPTTASPQIFLKMSSEMQNFVFGSQCHHYLHEVIQALREVTGSTGALVDMILYCSFCNRTFSIEFLKQIMLQYVTAPSGELKSLFIVLLDVLSMDDPLQLQRLQCIIDGYVDSNNVTYEGMLAVIKTNHSVDSRRSYQCIKFLVSLANRCSLAKDYLVQTPTKWQWAVNWLKKKMTEYTNPQTVMSNENSNTRSFQRTVSAQYTLEEATAMLTEVETTGALDIDTPAGGDQVPELDEESSKDPE